MSQDPSGDSVTYYTARKTRAGQWSSSFPMRNQRLVEADSLAQGHTARQWQRQDLNPGPVTPERFPPCVAAAPLEERRLLCLLTTSKTSLLWHRRLCGSTSRPLANQWRSFKLSPVAAARVARSGIPLSSAKGWEPTELSSQVRLPALPLTHLTAARI